MKFGLGVLHLAPDAFWRMTLSEYEAALAGHNAFHGGGDDDGPDVDIPRARAFLDQMKLEHPDTPNG